MAKDPDNKYLYDVAQSNLGTVVVPSDIEEQTEKALSNKGFAKSMSLTCLCAGLFLGGTSYLDSNDLKKKEQLADIQPLSAKERQNAATKLRMEAAPNIAIEHAIQHIQDNPAPSDQALKVPGFEIPAPTVEEVEETAHAVRQEALDEDRDTVFWQKLTGGAMGGFSLIFGISALGHGRRKIELEGLSARFSQRLTLKGTERYRVKSPHPIRLGTHSNHFKQQYEKYIIN